MTSQTLEPSVVICEEQGSQVSTEQAKEVLALLRRFGQSNLFQFTILAMLGHLLHHWYWCRLGGYELWNSVPPVPVGDWLRQWLLGVSGLFTSPYTEVVFSLPYWLMIPIFALHEEVVYRLPAAFFHKKRGVAITILIIWGGVLFGLAHGQRGILDQGIGGLTYGLVFCLAGGLRGRPFRATLVCVVKHTVWNLECHFQKAWPQIGTTLELCFILVMWLWIWFILRAVIHLLKNQTNTSPSSS